MNRTPWIAVTIAIVLATGGCCFPRLVTVSGTLPEAENEAGILRHDDWKYFGEGFSISVGTSDWKRDETGQSERPRIEGPKSRMVRFTISAKPKSAVSFDPAQVALVASGVAHAPRCMRKGERADEGSTCDSPPELPVLEIPGKTSFHLVFDVRLRDSSFLLIEGLTRHGERIALPRLALVQSEYDKWSGFCVVMND